MLREKSHFLLNFLYKLAMCYRFETFEKCENFEYILKGAKDVLKCVKILSVFRKVKKIF